jgi:predicted nucleic acid-binding protein
VISGSAVIVDSNVLLDVATADPTWGAWARDALVELADQAVLVINQIIYAESSPRFAGVEAFDDAFTPEEFRRESVPFEAAFLAGRCHQRYRRLGGARSTTLPDFFIGAHAAVRGYDLLTRDANRYRSYFPTVRVIAPN